MKKITFTSIVLLSFLISTSYSQTWMALNSQTQSDLNEVFYINGDIGWAFGDSLDQFGGFATGLLIKSQTQGAIWFQQSMGSPVYQIFDSYFTNTLTGIVVGRNKLSGNGAILLTADGGNSWTAAAPQPERLMAIHSVNANLSWAVGRNDFILRSTDAGNNWTDISANTGEHLNGVFFTSPNNGYVVGRAGVIIHSTDSGTTWISQNSNTNEDLEAVYFVNDSTGWAVGTVGEIVFTNDSGLTWTQQISNTPEDLFDVAFVDDTTGWAVGTAGEIVKTTDGGITWVLEASNTTEDIMSLTMQSSTLGWFCGTAGVIHIYSFNLPNSINELKEDLRVNVYPNPTNNKARIEFPYDDNWKIEIYNSNGKLVSSKQLLGVNKSTINKHSFSNGLYFLKFTPEKGNPIYQKIVFK